MKNYDNVFIVFETKSKRNIIDIFNHKCKSHKIYEEDLIIKENNMCLPIDLEDWKDIDDGTDFENVLKILERITNPKGGNPALILRAHLIGNDLNKKKSFKYIDTYKEGKHIVEMAD